jgi:hypothetical protein
MLVGMVTAVRQSRRPYRPALGHRVIAGGLALLTLVLGLLAVTPELHAWLHGHAHGTGTGVAACGHAHDADDRNDAHGVDHALGAGAHSAHGPMGGHAHDAEHSSHPERDPLAESDAGCVVQLFAQGVDSGVAPLVGVSAPECVVVETPRAPEALALAPTRYLRQPERGPPTA